MGGAPARDPGGCVFEGQVGVGVFNVTHAHREIDHCVAPPGVKACSREDMAVPPLTAMESEYNEPSEVDNGKGAGLVSRARIPLTLNPRKKRLSRIPPTLTDTTTRPAGHASRRRAHWRKEQGADARNKIHKKKSTKNMKDNQQTHLKGTSQSLYYTTRRTHARLFFWREAPPFSPRSHSHRESISSSSSTLCCAWPFKLDFQC